MSDVSPSRLLSESLLQAGRDPRLQVNPATVPTGAPSRGSVGFDVSPVSRARAEVHLSLDAPYRTFVLGFDTFDAAATYTVATGSVSESAATPATIAAALAALAGALASSLPLGSTAEVVGSTLVIRSPDPVSWTASGGSPVLTMAATATGCRARLFSRPAQAALGGYVSGVPAWSLHTEPDGSPADYIVTTEGLALDRVECGSASGMVWWISDAQVSGSDVCSPGAVTLTPPVAWVMPCLLGVR
jgi:hypothetical protein